MDIFFRIARYALLVTFLTGCTTLLTMQTVDLRNTTDFPDYDISAVVDDACLQRLKKSDQWTRDEFVAQWANETDDELVLLWLWHNGEVREMYRLPPKTLSRTSLLDGMGIAVINERLGNCLFTDVVTEQALEGKKQQFSESSTTVLNVQ